MNVRFSIIIFFCALGIALLGTRVPPTSAQSPTEEPTKRPYIFPTPIFVQTFPNDTPPPPPTRVAPTTTPQSTPGATTAPDRPSEQTYTVQPGDSLWIIAQKVYGNGARYPLIAAANDITTTTRLRTGMILKIPNAPGAVAVTPTALPFSPTPATLSTPTLLPTAPLPTPTLPPTPPGLFPVAMAGPITMAISILSALLGLASLAAAILAYLMYLRARRLQRIAEGKPPIRLQ